MSAVRGSIPGLDDTGAPVTGEVVAFPQFPPGPESTPRSLPHDRNSEGSAAPLDTEYPPTAPVPRPPVAFEPPAAAEPEPDRRSQASSAAKAPAVEPGSTHFFLARVRRLINRAYVREYGQLSVRVLAKGKKFRTRTIDYSPDPEWNEPFAFKLDPWDEITFELMDADWGPDSVVGRATVTLQRPKRTDRLWVPMIDPDSNKRCCDLLVYMAAHPITALSADSDNESNGDCPAVPFTRLAAVGIVAAKELPRSDPVIVLTMDNVTRHTGDRKSVV